MKTLLQINTSLFGENGNSSRLARRFVDGWRGSHPDGRVILRDLNRDPLPHLDAERAGAFFGKPDGRTPEQQAIVAASDVAAMGAQKPTILSTTKPVEAAAR